MAREVRGGALGAPAKLMRASESQDQHGNSPSVRAGRAASFVARGGARRRARWPHLAEVLLLIHILQVIQIIIIYLELLLRSMEKE